MASSDNFTDCILFTFVSDSESRTLSDTVRLFSKCGRKEGREGGKKEGRREGRMSRGNLPRVNTVLRIFCGYSIFPNREKSDISSSVALKQRMNLSMVLLTRS